MLYSIVIAFCLCIANGEWDAQLISKGKHPNHPRNLGCCIALVVFCSLIYGYGVAAPMLCMVPLVFDNYLNLRRPDVKLTYHPETMDTESIIDKAEVFVFRKHVWVKSNIFYLASFITGILCYGKY